MLWKRTAKEESKELGLIAACIQFFTYLLLHSPLMYISDHHETPECFCYCSHQFGEQEQASKIQTAYFTLICVGRELKYNPFGCPGPHPTQPWALAEMWTHSSLDSYAKASLPLSKIVPPKSPFFYFKNIPSSYHQTMQKVYLSPVYNLSLNTERLLWGLPEVFSYPS